MRTGIEPTSENDSRLDALEKAFRRQDAEIQCLKKENVDLGNLITSRDLIIKCHEGLHKRQADSLTLQASEIKDLKAKAHRLLAVALKNLIVQVLFGIILAKVMQAVPNARNA